MNKLLSLACLSLLIVPAHAADVVRDIPTAGPRVIDAVRPELNGVGTLSVPALSLPQASGMTIPGAEALAQALTPEASPMAAAAQIRIPTAQAESAGTRAESAAIGAAQNIATAAEKAQTEGGTAQVETTLNRTFDKLQTSGSAETSAPTEGTGSTVIKEGAKLQPAAPVAKKEAAAPESTTEIFNGVWKKTSSTPGFDRIKVETRQDAVIVSYGDRFQWGNGLYNVNKGPIQDKPWKGSFLAPGGLVTRTSQTRFAGNKIEEKSVRTETHWVRIPNRLVETRSLEAKDGKLVETSEAVLYRKLFFYFGPYTVPTKINTTNLADPARAKTVTVYERDTAPTASGNTSAPSKDETGPSTAQGPGLSRAAAKMGMAGVALMAAATPALAATQQAAAQPHAAGAALIGAVLGFIGLGFVGWLRRDKSSGGDFNFTPLFNAVRIGIYGLAGAAGAAILATAISHPAGMLALHFGASTLKAVIGAGSGFAAGALIGYETRERNHGGNFDFTPLFNGIKMLILGLIGAVIGAVGAGLI